MAALCLKFTFKAIPILFFLSLSLYNSLHNLKISCSLFCEISRRRFLIQTTNRVRLTFRFQSYQLTNFCSFSLKILHFSCRPGLFLGDRLKIFKIAKMNRWDLDAFLWIRRTPKEQSEGWSQETIFKTYSRQTNMVWKKLIPRRIKR